MFSKEKLQSEWVEVVIVGCATIVRGDYLGLGSFQEFSTCLIVVLVETFVFVLYGDPKT